MDYSKKTVKELQAICKELNMKGYSKIKKNQLIEMIQKNNIKTKPKNKVNKMNKLKEDKYTSQILKEQFSIHKDYVLRRMQTTNELGLRVRLPSIPEDISENIIKFIIHNKLNDKTSTRACNSGNTGDLYSELEGKQECKCFTSDGPTSFTPSSEWDVIYFLDARNWLENIFVLYKIPLKRTSNEWKNIKVSNSQTFEDQTKQGRRPRISWDGLLPQIKNYCVKVFEGTFEEIFIPVNPVNSVVEEVME